MLGCGPEAFVIQAVLFNFVAQNPEAGVQHLGGLALIAPGLAQGLGDQLLFQIGHLRGQAVLSVPGLLAL